MSPIKLFSVAVFVTLGLPLASGSSNDSNDSCKVDMKTWNSSSYPAVCQPNTWICLTISGGRSINYCYYVIYVM